MIISEEAYLAHYGILRRSGRYPWGSGGPEYASNAGFLGMVDSMKKQGMSEPEIARGLDITTTQLRAAKSIAVNEEKQAKIGQAEKLKTKGMSNNAIGKQMGINESSVRALLAPGIKDRADSLQTIAAMLKDQVDQKRFIDVGAGVENQLGISETKLKTAVSVLKEQGYTEHKVQIDQLQNSNQKTTTKVLCPPGTTYRDVKANRSEIKQITEFSEDGGRSMLGMKPPIQISSKRIDVKYKEDGGDQADGVIFVRPGVKDLSMGKSQYAQVRIAVDGTHYLKGMAVLKKDLPEGVDLQFNTNKSNTGNKLDAMKKLDADSDNPFGSIVRQRFDDPHDPHRVTSALNIVGMKEGSGEEGGWDTWSKSLSTQLLSKQSPKLAQKQLDVTFERKKRELDDIMGLTNPTVRRELLEKYASGADSSAVHLKAAALHRQATQVILPVTALKPHEIYAPNFRDGEQVALIRYPHGGTFEIPELTVNNKNRAAQQLLGKQAKDAVGIHPSVAHRLSGADFDGDTVVVIPNNNHQIESTAALKQLKDFDPQRLYKLPADAPKMTSDAKGYHMGMVSNLITDMTIKGASREELARAVKHSMVVIDAEKHHLDYKRSARDNGIKALNLKYQGKTQGGSATLVSRATSKTSVPLRKERSPKDGGPIDPKTGKKMYGEPETFVNRDGVTVTRKIKIDKLAATDDAHTLVSADGGTTIEKIYADHSNRMKQLANDARKEVAQFKPPLISKSAKEAYSEEVKSLNAKLSLARKNKPLERQAQIIANHNVAMKKEANPNLDASDIKKIKTQALTEARKRTGADKHLIVPTAQEWAAIQAGAISYNQLNQILKSADLDAVRVLATPRHVLDMTPAKTARAKDMAASGYTQAEISDALGVSVTTLKNALND